MKTIDDIMDKKIPLVAVDKSMDRLQDKVVFKSKLEKANEVLLNIKLPKNVHAK